MRASILKLVDPKGTNLVTQANKLIEARYSATKNELIIIFIMMSFIEPDDSEFLTFKTSIPQLADFMRVDRKSMKRELKTIVERLLSRVVEIETPNGWKMHQWISYAEANYKEDTLELRFHDHLKPHLLGLKKYFNSLDVFSFLDFKSVYTLRMYHLLRDFDGQKKIKFTYELIDYKKIVLGSRKQDLKKYPLFNNFKNRVLELSKKELDEKSKISFTYKTIRVGRNIGKIEFTIIKKNQTKTASPALPAQTNNDEDEQQSQEIREMLSIGITKEKAFFLLEKHGAEYIIKKLRFTAEKERDNPAGFFIQAVNIGWESPAEKKEEKAQKKRSEKQEKQQRKKELEKATEKLSSKFTKTAINDYLEGLGGKEKKKKLQDLKNEYPQIAKHITSLNEGAGAGFLLNEIPNYKDNMENFINAELQKMGLIQGEENETGK